MVDKGANNFSSIWRKYYFSNFSDEFALCNSKSKSDSKGAPYIEDIVQENINDCQKFNLNILEPDKTFPTHLLVT